MSTRVPFVVRFWLPLGLLWCLWGSPAGGQTRLNFSNADSYAQGMALLKKATVAHGYVYHFSEIPRIWKGGCIIRARFLGEIQPAYKRDPELMPKTLARINCSTTSFNPANVPP